MHTKLYISVSASRRYRAGRFQSFYLRSLLPQDPFVRMNPRERFTMVYFQTADENIYKIAFEGEQLVLTDGSDSARYLFTPEELKTFVDRDNPQGTLSKWEGFFYGGQITDPVMRIECISTLRDYSANDEWFKGVKPAALADVFERQQVINANKAIVVNA